jgi:hypothetical protein
MPAGMHMSGTRHCAILLSGEIAGPVTFGWLRPVVLLPLRYPSRRSKLLVAFGLCGRSVLAGDGRISGVGRASGGGGCARSLGKSERNEVDAPVAPYVSGRCYGEGNWRNCGRAGEAGRQRRSGRGQRAERAGRTSRGRAVVGADMAFRQVRGVDGASDHRYCHAGDGRRMHSPCCRSGSGYERPG